MLCAPLLLAATASEAAAAHDGSPAAFTALLFVFLLATFIGLGVVTRVSRLLHTPLMSLTNAISAIAVVGSIVIAGQDHPPLIRLLGSPHELSSEAVSALEALRGPSGYPLPPGTAGKPSR